MLTPILKIVHAADLHLDSQMRNLTRYQGAPLESLRGATRRALENLVRLCIDERAKLLLIAGDVYDGDWQDYNTGLFFNQQMRRLGRAGVRVVMVSGNHDAQSVISRQLSLPDNVYNLATDQPETLRLDELRLAVHGRGYGRREVTDNLAVGYPPPLPDYYNVGLLHTALDGREGHDNYAPCQRAELIAKGYDYWALGHVHQREVVCREPWIVFPGNLQGRHIRETGAKGASVVSFDHGVVEVAHRELDVLRWVRCEVGLDEANDAEEILLLVQSALDRELGAAAGRPLAVRLQLGGVCAEQQSLLGDPQRWRNELRSAAGQVSENIWLEKISFATRSAADPESLALGSDPLAELLRGLRAARDDPEQQRRLSEQLGARIRLPGVYLGLDDAIDPSRPEAWPGLLEDTERLLLSRLLQTRDD